MNRNGLLAALYTMGITLVGAGVFWVVLMLIKYYPEISGYIFTFCMACIIFMIFIQPLWESIKKDLDNGDRR
jgi:zinc transporter ZupT